MVNSVVAVPDADWIASVWVPAFSVFRYSAVSFTIVLPSDSVYLSALRISPSTATCRKSASAALERKVSPSPTLRVNAPLAPSIISGGSFSESVWEYVVPALNAELKSGDRYSYYEDVNAAIAAAKPGDQVSARPSDSGDAPAATCSVTLKDGDAEETVITVKKNTQITLPVLTKDGYTFLGWKLDGELYTGSYTVTADVTFTAVWKNNSALPSWITALPALDGSKKLPFTDVWRGDWYYDGVRYVYDNDLMNGTSGTVFSPNADTTRGMIVTILARMDGVNTSGTPWYEAGREWAMRNGISDGTNMEGKITREQLAAMLSRYAALKNRDVSAIASISAYADASSVSNWAVNAMRWAVGEGLIQGSNNSLRPQSNATRAEVATILMRFCELLKK